MSNKAKLKKWVIRIITLFMCYHVISFVVTFCIGMGNVSFWMDDVKYSFGKNLRTDVAVIDDVYPRWILCDVSPEDQVELKKKNRSGIKGKILDHNIYAYEGKEGFFFTYKDDVLYSYGSTGFFVIYADPFQIKLLRNETLSGKWRETVDKGLIRYGENEFKVVDSSEELTIEEQEAYERLKVKAEKRIEELKKANEYP